MKKCKYCIKEPQWTCCLSCFLKNEEKERKKNVKKRN